MEQEIKEMKETIIEIKYELNHLKNKKIVVVNGTTKEISVDDAVKELWEDMKVLKNRTEVLSDVQMFFTSIEKMKKYIMPFVKGIAYILLLISVVVAIKTQAWNVVSELLKMIL